MKKPGPGFRHMTPSEAEEVDKEVLSEVFHLVYHEGNTLDAALEALVREDIKMVSVPSSLPLSRPRLLRLETGPPSSVAGSMMRPEQRARIVLLGRILAAANLAMDANLLTPNPLSD